LGRSLQTPVTTNKPQLAHQAPLHVTRRYTPFEIKYLFKMLHFRTVGRQHHALSQLGVAVSARKVKRGLPLSRVTAGVAMIGVHLKPVLPSYSVGLCVPLS
jgi:hypothetical protein